MKNPKRLRFTPSKSSRVRQQAALGALQAICNGVSQVAGALSQAVKSLQRTCAGVAAAASAWLVSPEVQEEIKMQQLYYQSWMRNELADTLAAAGISA